ncbi:hypothetical protein [Allosalinactinospora lopnorensis]|uniref:hypothetical protein n=1 Tax=Allosalinactinospora lopnorensis TaxID=1352348 RepID=UPI0009E4B1AF|nr:hypothetical protein [Allosalinactinospora lopnorensis]
MNNQAQVASAIGRLARLPQDILDIGARVAATDLGPWHIAVNCTYDPFLFWDTKRAQYGYEVSFSAIRGPISGILFEAANEGRSTLSDYRALLDWMRDTVPATDDAYRGATRLVNDVRSAIDRGEQPGPGDREQLHTALTTLYRHLDGSKEVFSSLTSRIARHSQRTDAALDSLVRLAEEFERSAAASLSAMREFIDDKPCGKDNAMRQFERVRSTFEESVARLREEITVLRQRLSQTGNAIALVAGNTLVLASTAKNAADAVERAGEAEIGTVIQRISLSGSQHFWEEVVRSVRANLDTIESGYAKHALAS